MSLWTTITCVTSELRGTGAQSHLGAQSRLRDNFMMGCILFRSFLFDNKITMSQCRLSYTCTTHNCTRTNDFFCRAQGKHIFYRSRNRVELAPASLNRPNIHWPRGPSTHMDPWTSRNRLLGPSDWVLRVPQSPAPAEQKVPTIFEQRISRKCIQMLLSCKAS